MGWLRWLGNRTSYSLHADIHFHDHVLIEGHYTRQLYKVPAMYTKLGDMLMNLLLIGFYHKKKPINCKIVDAALLPLIPTHTNEVHIGEKTNELHAYWDITLLPTQVR